MATTSVPDPLPETIHRPRDHVHAIRAQSLLEMGTEGRTALAWEWALTGTCPAPVTLSLAPGHPPSRDQILAEATAPPEGSTAPPGVPTDSFDQLAETRRVLAWLAGSTDEIPVDDDNRGRLIGARDNYARTNQDIRHARDHALHSLENHDHPPSANPPAATNRSLLASRWMDTAWLRGVSDLLDWVLGDRPDSPIGHRTPSMPTVYDLTYEEGAAEDLIAQDQPSRISIEPGTYPPSQYGHAIEATICWLRGESTVPPVNQEG